MEIAYEQVRTLNSFQVFRSLKKNLRIKILLIYEVIQCT